ncbi:ketopantoate reductase family protein [Exiguobacterium qingdaonense]|uniref:ketopantoate reductase family protein n=1 Tax=Exiguobacterium qingdaonense TaxID=2751251 RepID=UPI001BE81968|nr:2-dehydropantoate 2-reductase [Exiguobacterium qingdaonense]
MNPIKRVGIIGNGAVGLLMASVLANDYDVTVYGRSTSLEEISITRSGLTSGSARVPLRSSETLLETDQDIFFVTTKAHHVEEATARLSGKVPVFICSNGIAHLDYVKRRGFHLGVVEHGVTKQGDQIEHRGLGRIRIGSTTGLSPVMFQENPLHITWEEDIEQVVIEKLFANAIINPITALCSVKNGALANSPCRDIAQTIYDELTSIFPQHVSYAYIDSIIERTAENRSSMLRDLEEGRPTEVDAILKPVIEKADQMKISLSVIPLLHKLILGASASC